MKILERNIVLQIILSLVTCGIYGIIWFVQLTNDAVAASDGKQYQTSGGMAFLLTLLTCGIYGIYWGYKIGQCISVIKAKTSNSTEDNALIYLILSVVGLQIVVYILAQSELNNYSKLQNGQTTTV